jgi:uncharacterized protein
MDSFARWLVRHPLLFIAGNLAITVVLGLFALRIRIESGVETVIPPNDPEITYYEEVRKTFGSDDVAVVGVLAPPGKDIFEKATLLKIAKLSDELAKLPGVIQVISITNAIDPAADLLNPPKLLPSMPPLQGEIDDLKKKLAAIPLYGKNLVSDDFRGAAINMFFENLTYDEYVDKNIDGQIQALIAEAQGPESIHFTGAAHVTIAAIEMLRRDLYRFTPLAVVLVVVALWLSFWTVRGVVLPLVSVLMAVIWTLGFMVIVGKSLTLGTFVLPPLLLVIGSSYAIHVMARYYEQVERGTPADELVVQAFRRVWLPLSLSAFTVVVGFASLMGNRIPAIFELGLFAGFGATCLLVTSLTFIPAALAMMQSTARTRRSGKRSASLDFVLNILAKKTFGRQREVFAIAIVVGAISLVAAFFVRVDSNFLAYFRPDSPVRGDNEVINESIVGSNIFYLTVEGEGAAALKQWDVLKLVDDLQNYVESLPGVTSTLSVVDYLGLFEMGLNKQAEGGDVLLDEQGNIMEQQVAKPFREDPKSLPPLFEILNANPGVFKAVVTPDYSRGNILVRTRFAGSREVEALLEQIRAWVHEHFPPVVRVHPTGTLVLIAGTASDIVQGQAESLGSAVLVIFVLLAMMFVSLKIGFLAILPNALPIAIFFGIMGACGIDLNLGTSLIAAIALGLAVDSTVHYMARLNQELRGATDQRGALERTLRAVGPPIVYTTFTLFLGFLMFAFSGFVPIQQFGVLSAITLGVSLVTNLVLLPALLSTTSIITMWDLVAVRLGQDPAGTIPLFHGLRPAQARVVVLMGELRRFKTGQSIVKRGEKGTEMYVVLSGRGEVFIGEGTERKKLNELKRGDVFGEMALVRQAERSADVIASEPLEVLAVDERFLERVQSRYPRIASIVFLNLTRILSDRLQALSDRWATARA